MDAYVPPQLASEAAELLIAFAHWCDEHTAVVLSEEWTLEQLVDLFIMEAGGNG